MTRRVELRVCKVDRLEIRIAQRLSQAKSVFGGEAVAQAVDSGTFRLMIGHDFRQFIGFLTAGRW